ncbi:MAG: hypothetical protein DRR19_00320 [Candidatus Parabeggiatoa sp. nov. 1]|nr:MAG: hypothetical protein DRR19_00320 [Gammaproteobacteria bacterium]
MGVAHWIFKKILNWNNKAIIHFAVVEFPDLPINCPENSWEKPYHLEGFAQNFSPIATTAILILEIE